MPVGSHHLASECSTYSYRLQNETDFFQDVGGVTRDVYTCAAEKVLVGISCVCVAHRLLYSYLPNLKDYSQESSMVQMEATCASGTAVNRV